MSYTVEALYGIDDDIISCPICSSTKLILDIVQARLSGIGITPNWYCEICKTVWIKGLKKPRYSK